MTVDRPLEFLRAVPCLLSEELYRDVPESLPRNAVVDVVAPSRNDCVTSCALRLSDPVRCWRCQPMSLRRAGGARGHPVEQLVKNIVLPHHVRAARRQPDHNLLVSEIVYADKVGFPHDCINSVASTPSSTTDHPS